MRRTGALAVALVVLLTAASSTAAPLGDRAASTRQAPAARNDATLGERLARALRVPHVDRSESAAVALDLGTGEELFALNESRPLAPASNEKLALTFALLSTLSPSLRIETTAKAIGTVEGDTLRGAIALVGGGDPTLTSSDLLELARRVRASGIRRITGGVLGDESLFDSMRTCLGWKPYFYINESPPLSALVVDRAWYHSYTARRPAKAAALLFRDALRAAGVAVAGNVAVRVTPPEAPLIVEDALGAAGEHHRLHGSAQRQLHGRATAQAPVPDAVGTRKQRGRRAGRHDGPRRRGHPDERGTDRRRLRPLGEGSAHHRGARRNPPGDRRPAGAGGSAAARASSRRHERNAEVPDAETAGPRARRGEDRHDEHRVLAVGLRQLPHRVRDHPERPPDRVMVGSRSAGPLRKVLAAQG